MEKLFLLVTHTLLSFDGIKKGNEFEGAFYSNKRKWATGMLANFTLLTNNDNHDDDEDEQLIYNNSM